ncbi:hypothetical protein LZ30DRAFT_801364 [Colletotrichum cereale]|nr:hypothetical protein LZ30DRAFT_801364 [Colletotrichum cereale]
MHFIYLLLLSICSTSAAPVPGISAELKAGGGFYTVVRRESMFSVYTPFYLAGKLSVTDLEFPIDNKDVLVIDRAVNGYEKSHQDGSTILRLSEVLQAVATESAHVDLGEIVWVKVDNNALNEPTKEVVEDIFIDWRKSENQPTDAIPPQKLTVKSDDSFWPAINKTAFLKEINHAVAPQRKVDFVTIASPNPWKTHLWLHIGPS